MEMIRPTMEGRSKQKPDLTKVKDLCLERKPRPDQQKPYAKIVRGNEEMSTTTLREITCAS